MQSSKLFNILEEAQAMHERAMKCFDYHVNEADDEMKQIYWTRSEEYSGKCEGLLTAYEIITGRCIMDHRILEEIEYQTSKF